jgi:cytochrome c peroxidase
MNQLTFSDYRSTSGPRRFLPGASGAELPGAGVPGCRTATQREGGRHIASEAPTLRNIILATLYEAGPHGATIQELAEVVTRKRGTLTKETTSYDN